MGHPPVRKKYSYIAYCTFTCITVGKAEVFRFLCKQGGLSTRIPNVRHTAAYCASTTSALSTPCKGCGCCWCCRNLASKSSKYSLLLISVNL